MLFPATPQETPEQNAARLAKAPVNSVLHRLSDVPVTIASISIGQIIELPEAFIEKEQNIIVTPMKRHTHVQPLTTPRLRNHATWDCLVIGGKNSTYQQGCWEISLDEAVLVRGTQIILTSADQVRQTEDQAV